MRNAVSQLQPSSVEIPYITTLDGNNYQLLGVKLGYLDGTKIVVTGWLQVPSRSSAAVLSPALTFAGDINVTNLQAHCEKHLG